MLKSYPLSNLNFSKHICNFLYFYSCTHIIFCFVNLPLSHSSFTFISNIFVCVISLCDAKKSTTSRFSFLIGTMSKRHQNGEPVKEKDVEVKVAYLHKLKRYGCVCICMLKSLKCKSRKMSKALSWQLLVDWVCCWHGVYVIYIYLCTVA